MRFEMNERTTTTKKSINNTCRIRISLTTTRIIIITGTQLDYLSAPSIPPLNQYTNEPKTQTQVSLTDLSKHMHKWIVNHTVSSNPLDILYDNFKYGIIQVGSKRSCIENLGISSAAWRLESKCGRKFIEVRGMVTGKPEDQNSYRGKLGGKLGIIICIHRL